MAISKIHFIRNLGIANDALSAQLLFIIKSDLYQIVSRSHLQNYFCRLNGDQQAHKEEWLMV